MKENVSSKVEQQRQAAINAMKAIQDARFALEMLAIEFGDTDAHVLEAETKQLTGVLQRVGNAFLVN